MSNATVTTTADVATALDALFASARRARSRAGTLPGDLTLPQCHLLDPLVGGATQGAGELALAAGVSRPTATRMLDGLEREGVVTRRRSGEDRRCVHVTLTAAGAERVALAAAARTAWREQVLAALPPAEHAETARVLTRLTALLEDLV